MVREINVITKVETIRDYTQKELDDIAASRIVDQALRDAQPKTLTFDSVENLLKKVGVSDVDIQAAKK